MECMSQISMTTEVKEHIEFYYLLIEIRLYTSILWDLNIFFKKYLAKSKINQLLIIQLGYEIMIALCVGFIVLVS